MTNFFKDKVVFVTGGAKNLGRAMALEYAKRGAHVAINARTHSVELDETLSMIAAIGGRSIACIGDITQRAEVDQMIENVKQEYQRIDILINNAVTHATQAFLELDYADWQRTISVTLDGTFHCTQAVVPLMIQSGGGSIINMGGMFGHMPVPNRSPSSVAKAGLAGLTRALALEFAKYNINVNYLAPGPANTVRDPSKPFQFDLSRIPFGRFTEASEVVNMVMLLSGQEGRYITGQSMHVNGGVFMNN
ncbi:SDR family NAD(P)-dependent oxidoreductase [Polynucleobacter kasalickyi]|uniref:3-oxoacyl-[acyl-carrier protein] reductase n=1 Tax=Polynucleobacter kasalickyi TaxID=1938817 RepID=A0A1W1YAH7_9BURK|nr:SDR family NAD(P)-dependent oxidoreductase [Polynucleobacter kasalickyi]SMC33143.1 3-oxoacyl-[acyl-carrier protein] reductase [Polynucleobacter kasalickyi]